MVRFVSKEGCYYNGRFVPLFEVTINKSDLLFQQFCEVNWLEIA